MSRKWEDFDKADKDAIFGAMWRSFALGLVLGIALVLLVEHLRWS